MSRDVIFELRPSEPWNVLRTKHLAALRKDLKYIWGIVPNGDLTAWEHRFLQFADAYVRALRDIIATASGETREQLGRSQDEGANPMNEESSHPHSEAQVVLDVLFSGNVRAMLNNLNVAYHYVRKIAQTWDRTVNDPAQGDSAWAEYLRQHEQVIVEGSMTSGAYFMLRPRDDPNAVHGDADGAWMPNLFFFIRPDDEPYATYWQGLCVLRLLQLLEARGDRGLTEATAKAALAEMGYATENVRRAVSVAWKYGLWRAAGEVAVQQPGNESVAADTKLVATPKAVVVQKLAFADPSVTYFQATGTQMRLRHIQQKGWTLHNPSAAPDHPSHANRRRMFTTAECLVGVTMMRYILQAMRREEERGLLERVESLKVERSYFQAPRPELEGKWLKRLAGRVESLLKRPVGSNDRAEATSVLAALEEWQAQ
jgi:hypothetical protein